MQSLLVYFYRLYSVAQPNGTILTLYKQKSQSKHTSTDLDRKDSKIQDKKNLIPMDFRLNKIKEEVIESSRKLFKPAYQNQINRLIFQKSLVFYKAKYNILIIVVVKEFSVHVEDIQQLMQFCFGWFDQKCHSMSIQTKLSNRPFSLYNLRQFNKVQIDIKSYLHENGKKTRKNSNHPRKALKKQKYIEQKFENIQFDIQQRDETLHQIKRASRQFRRQFSFKDKAMKVVNIQKSMRNVLYLCVIIVFGISLLAYSGWFSSEEI